RVRHSASFFQRGGNACNRRCLLAYGDVDTVNRLSLSVVFPLVDNRIDGNCRFSGLTVSDDQLALSAADGDHGVDSLDTRLQRFIHWLTVDNAGSFALERHFIEFAGNGAFTVNRLAKGINDTAEHAVANGNGRDLARAAYGVAFMNIF